jgi:transcription termination factor Rho
MGYEMDAEVMTEEENIERGTLNAEHRMGEGTVASKEGGSAAPEFTRRGGGDAETNAASPSDLTSVRALATEEPGSPTPATEEAPMRGLDLNELQAMPGDQLKAVAREFNFHLGAGRSTHQQLLDLVRHSLGRGGTVTTEGFFDQTSDSFGLLRWPRLNFLSVPEDVCVSRALVQQFHLRPSQLLAGTIRLPRDREKGLMLDQVTSIEGEPAENWTEPTDFEKLTPQFPQGRIMLENEKTKSISARAVDLLAPLGRGQRGLIVAPPRVGKTILLKEIARAIRANYPEIVLIMLLVDERPEEVTDLEREIDCQIYHSNFDENVLRHIQVAEMVIERAKRLVELKKDVVILLDSITRLSRGYNQLQSGKGRTMSGGVEAKALTKPKKFFGSARNVEEGGSLTVLATALIETGSRMDQLIFEEFKGTGNMELHLDRRLVDKRVWPAIDVNASGTRKEDLLTTPDELRMTYILRKVLSDMNPIEAMELLVSRVTRTKSNAEFLKTLNLA